MLFYKHKPEELKAIGVIKVLKYSRNFCKRTKLKDLYYLTLQLTNDST